VAEGGRIKVTPYARAFILGRARAFAPDGQPWFTYPRIRRNLARSKSGVSISTQTVRWIVKRYAPELYARRKAAYLARVHSRQ
jgi:hypothetical protein